MGDDQEPSMYECAPEEYKHYQTWYNMQEGPEKQTTSPLVPSFSSLSPTARFRRVQYLHFRTWCNLPNEVEKQRMKMLLQPPPVSNYVERYPFRESHPWDALALTARERYALWEGATIRTFCFLMDQAKLIQPLGKIIIDFMNPYTPKNIIRARIRAQKRRNYEELARVGQKRRIEQWPQWKQKRLQM